MDCSIDTCPSHCSAHGTCLDGACTCDQGWAGRACDEPACVGGCSGHGSCVEGRCNCDAGWTGTRCSWDTRCPNRCHGRGRCTAAGTCECEQGYSGADCSVSPSCELVSPNCSGHGECTHSRPTTACRCWRGWEGGFCGTRSQPHREAARLAAGAAKEVGARRREAQAEVGAREGAQLRDQVRAEARARARAELAAELAAEVAAAEAARVDDTYLHNPPVSRPDR